MSTQIHRARLSLKGLLMGAGVLIITVGPAIGQESILHQAIHDYADDARGSFSDPGPGYLTGRYTTETVLEEAYHDYDGSVVRASDLLAIQSTEGAEFAAFEHGSTFEDIVPWELWQ